MHIPIPVTRILVSATDDVRLEYTCPHCRHVAQADVIATFTSMREAVLGIGKEHAAADAREEAIGQVPEVAARLVGLAGCPKCRERHPRSVSRARLDALMDVYGSWLGVMCTCVALFGILIVFSASDFVFRLEAAAVTFAILAAPCLFFPSRMRTRVAGAEASVAWVHPSPVV